jgi:hypothetical protein
MDQDHSFAEEKGKGKAPAEHITEDSAMDEDDDDDSDDEDEEVRFPPPALYCLTAC